MYAIPKAGASVTQRLTCAKKISQVRNLTLKFK